jgi:hypothetical protein
MKKIIIILALACIICSCSSAPKKEEPFTVDLKSPRHTAGSAEAYFDQYLALGDLKKGEINVYYYPVEDAVCLNFKVMQFVHCDQFWDKTGRDAFISAFERYKIDYEQRQLGTKKSRKTRGAYGEVQGFFMWKKTAISVQAHGSPKVKLGYQLKDKSAFFTTTQMESYYEDPYSRTRGGTSPVTVLYFTRSQAENLAELFKQEHLDGLGRPAAVSGNSSVKADEHEEYEEGE